MTWGTAPKIRSKKVIRLLKSRYAPELIRAIKSDRLKEAGVYVGEAGYHGEEKNGAFITVKRVGSYSSKVNVEANH